MPTIDDLPNELLHLILECVHEDQAFTTTEVAHREVLHSLASASLVARHWRMPAQSFMWKDLMVIDDAQVRRVLASASLGRHRTIELDAAVTTASVYEPLGQLIEALDGLEHMDVEDVCVGNHVLQVDWLFSARLKGLKSLNFNLNPAFDAAISRPHFQLTSLELGWLVDDPRFAKVILDVSRSTLTSLTLATINPAIHPILLDFISHRGGQLEDLGDLGPHEMDLLLPQAASLIRLEYLVIHFDTIVEGGVVDTFLRALPSNSDSEPMQLDVTVTRNDDRNSPAAQLAREAQPGVLIERLGRKEWKGLSAFIFEGTTKEEVEAMPLGESFLDLCEKKGIAVTFE